MSSETFIYDKCRSHFPYTPSEDQVNLIQELSAFLMQVDEQDVMLVNGYAGTGKTSVIAAFVKTLKELGVDYVLMAPTGRAAKVLGNYTGEKSFTVHKQIYRQKRQNDQNSQFSINFNKKRDTIFVVDEASLISIDSIGSIFGSGNLLDDLIDYVRSNQGNKLILIGDDAQLPPIGMELSPALNPNYLAKYGPLRKAELKEVLRQGVDSGILYNATLLRKNIVLQNLSLPKFELENYTDIKKIAGSELIEELGDAISRNGIEEVLVLCRSNKRANRYNAGIRSSVLFCDERLTRGDRIMVVKNCYNFLDDVPEIDFIANGDVAELLRIRNYEERYGLEFADALLSFPDYNDLEIEAKIILDTLESESASLTKDQNQALFEGVYADYEHLKTKSARFKAIKQDPYFNAIQIKYSNAITTHKSQGGQWKVVFIDNPFWKPEITLDELKWLYTAMTRATHKLFLVNFKD